MTSRYIEIRPDNQPSDGKVSFKKGFPVLSFTIQSQSGVVDPATIRINGNLKVYSDNGTPVQAGSKLTMDNRLGIYNVMDQLVIRHNKSKMICEHIRNYPRYMTSYLGVASSKGDLMGPLGEAALCLPNSEAFQETVILNDAGGDVEASFSAHLPSGFMSSGQRVNLMDQSFGGFQIEIHLSPDNNALYTEDGTTPATDPYYELSNLKLTAEIQDVAPEEVAKLQSQTSGAYAFNTITSLYTSINSTNAQLQYSLGLKQLQSVFLNFCPSANINTITDNGMATTYPSSDTGAIAHFKRIQFLRGGVKYPEDFDVVTNIDKDGNVSTVDPQVLKDFVEAIIPEGRVDRTTVSTQNNNRNYTMASDSDANVLSYKLVADGGALMGVGCRYSQYNTGQNFENEQWGLSLESNLTTDNPVSVFIYFKSRATLVWGANGVQLQN
tara:strand:+ start:444 stop:1760 length:1317 start_codon:yes stop_codon:yes gene_type:complete